MPTPEGKLKKKVVKILLDEGAYVVSIVTGGYGKSGIPDIIFCLNGQFGAIEVKAGIDGWEKLTELQKKNLNQISIARGKSLVVDERTIELLKWFLKEAFQ